ncbi:MAG: LysM peptidoglycan-binding domain-containing protein [Campylobacteraceae bacterium]|jgi:membrane-bound lytic murein transglycosylase D|nr:LysM peptidoglycan-binding domain-containing protein [Campylobacteraceae bacterium]
MKRLLAVLILTMNFCFGYFIVEDDYAKQVEVLKSLDIDTSFLQDSIFESMKDNIRNYKTKQFLKTLENGAQFVPVLKKMIEEAEIPDVFLYLAMAESGFSTKAYSKAKASGLWQFMSATAKKYNLLIDDYVDERRDPVKSTEAAIKYLQVLHDRFGKWYLAAMAYNCGEGRVSRAIAEAGTDNLYALLDENKKYLPLETRNYIRKIVTMAYLSQDVNFLLDNGASYVLNGGDMSSPFVKVDVYGGSSLADVAEAIDMPIRELLAYNTHLKYFFTPPNKNRYHIYIPSNKLTRFKSDFKMEKGNSKYYVYTVAKGDSLQKIAKQYDVSYKIIKDFNSMRSDTIRAGQKLIIPTSSNTVKYYTIQKGDTLQSISTKYKLTVAQLMQTNNLKDSTIIPGVKLEIPASN